MRLPFLQVDQRAFTSARLLGQLVSLSEAETLGRMLRVWADVLDLAPDDTPPERLGLLGEGAETLLAASFGLPVERGAALVDAMVLAGFLERVPEGLRLRGLHRYGQVLAKRVTDRERLAAKRATLRVAPPLRVVAGESEESRGDVAATPSDVPGKTHTHTYKKQETETADKTPPSDAPQQAELVPSSTPADLQALWNAERKGAMPEWARMTDKRRKACATRLKERGLEGSEGWRAVVQRMAASPFCRGEKGDFAASPEFLLKPDTAEKVLAGYYDERNTAASRATPRGLQASDYRAGEVVL